MISFGASLPKECFICFKSYVRVGYLLNGMWKKKKENSSVEPHKPKLGEESYSVLEMYKSSFVSNFFVI